MSSIHSTMRQGYLPDFTAPLTQEAVYCTSKTIKDDLARDSIIRLAKYLLKIEGRHSLLGKPKVNGDAHTMTLRTLYERLQDGKVAPIDLDDSPFIDNKNIKRRVTVPTDTPLEDRPLAELEDLYYLIIARIKEIHHVLAARVKSGFCTMSSPMFDSKTSPSLDLFIHCLSGQWDTLNNAKFGKTVDNAVRSARAKHITDEIAARVEDNEVSGTLAQAQIQELTGPEVFNDIHGMWNVHGFAPAMIVKYVEKKYDLIFREEKEAANKSTVQTKRRVASRTTRGTVCPDSKRGKRISAGTLNTKGLSVVTWSNDHTDDCVNLINELKDLGLNDLNLSSRSLQLSGGIALDAQISPLDGPSELSSDESADTSLLSASMLSAMSYDNDLSVEATEPDDCCSHMFFSPKIAREHSSQFKYTAEEFADMVANAKPLMPIEPQFDFSMQPEPKAKSMMHDDLLFFDTSIIQEELDRFRQQYLQDTIEWESQAYWTQSYGNTFGDWVIN